MALGNQFSAVFGVDPAWMASQKVLDPTLDIDVPLFIDPFLLSYSVHPEFSGCAFETYNGHFSTIYRVLSSSRHPGDKPWQLAHQLFMRGEVAGMHGTCLGYSKKSNRGHAFGEQKAEQSVRWAKEVIELGVKDPELFLLLPLFEGGVGADLISDMVASISLECILSFNKRIISEIERDLGIKLPVKSFRVAGRDFDLVPNPYEVDEHGIILLPSDILKNLPIMEDPRQLANAIEQNKQLRDRVNAQITEIFSVRFKKDRDSIKDAAMRDAGAFQSLLDILKIVEKTPYDVERDPDGLLRWRALADAAVKNCNPEIFDNDKLSEIDRIQNVVEQIIGKFRDLVENNRLNRVFYVDHKPRPERFAQLLFYAVAESFCAANGLDISPESDAGAGPVDFKISSGSERIVVEIKLSTNSKSVTGYESQLNAYIQAEKARRGHYVVINVGSLGKKWRRISDLHASNRKFASIKSIHLVDGLEKVSASNLKLDGDDFVEDDENDADAS